MKKDILQFYKETNISYSTGLFTIPINDRKCSKNINKSKYGVSYTKFEDANDYKINNYLTLLDMFHGLCLPYMSYFITMNPDWKPMKLCRPGMFNELNHVFATKTINGITYFADARGITANCLDFFDDYKYSAKTMDIQEIHNLPELDFDDAMIVKTSYDMIYGNKPISIERMI